MAKTPTLYLIRAGRHGEDDDLFLESGMAILGFREIPSLEGATDREEVKRRVCAATPDAKPKAQALCAGQLWRFSGAMKQGDLVALPRTRTSQIAIGRVSGPYKYQRVNAESRHTRPVEWLKTELPRRSFRQDLLAALSARMTVCTISRNNAAARVQAVLDGAPDPGPPLTPAEAMENESDSRLDLPQLAHDQIVGHIESRFTRFRLEDLVAAVLQADGWVTKSSSRGPDGGVDILASRGSLGLDGPRLCVQVKSSKTPADVTIYRSLQGVISTFSAEHGLLVCWGGFNGALLKEAKQSHFTVRLWNSEDLVEAIYRNYDRLPADIRAELPLEQVWTLVPDDSDG